MALGGAARKNLNEIKKVLTSKPVLSYYDVNKPVKPSVDASQSGLGAVLLQDNQPASKFLTDCQKGYAQIEKETLAIVFRCELFHQYLYGKEIEVESDHKPLEAIFAKPIAKAPPRIQRLLLRLQHYHLKVKYVPGKLMFIADALSRAHLETTNTNQGIPDAETEMQIYLLKLYFDRGAKSLPPVTTGDTVQMKTKNGWKPATVTKLAYTPRSVIVNSNETLYRRNKRDIITTPEVTSPKGDRGITQSRGSDRTIIKTPEVVRTRYARTIRAPRQDDFIYRYY
ncbi:hypothetical protein ACROYT_G025395 [Oculina patagonica]